MTIKALMSSVHNMQREVISRVFRAATFLPWFALIAACAAGDPESGVGPTPPIAAADSTVVTLDNSVTYQPVDGFGGTTLTLVYSNRDYLGVYRPAAIKAAFGDVGISLGTFNIGIQETPANATDRYSQRGNDNSDPFTINPAGFNFADSDIVREKLLLPATSFGFGEPELGQFIDLRGPVSWLATVRSASYTRYLDEAAEYVLAIMQYWRGSYGLTPRLVHLFNEPTSGNTELGRSASIQEVVDLVKRVGDRLRSGGFPAVKFIVPNEESIDRNVTVARAILSDAGARPYVGVIGYHPYPYGSAYVSPRRILETSGAGAPDRAARQSLEQLRALGQQYGVPIWLTEVTEGPGTNDYGFDAIENVLARAIHIHDNYEFAGASGYFGMVTIWDSQSHAEHFAGRNVPFLSAQSGIVLVDVGTGKIYITGMGYAVGHYARWVRPGALRIAASSDRARVIVTGFRDVARSRLVLVVVNNESTSQLVRVRVSGSQPRGQATGETSYGQSRWASLENIRTGSDGAVEVLAQARSVVSLAIPY